MGRVPRKWKSLLIALLGTAVLCAPAAQSAPTPPTGKAWVQRALRLQYELGSDLGMRNAPWVSTHNSFNSKAEMGQTVSTQDSNQEIAIVDQLQQGIRGIELDLHYFVHPPEGLTPVVCHGLDRSQAHAGCTTEKTLATVLDEIVPWLRSHPREVILLYLEDDMDERGGYDAAGEIVSEKLGSRLYKPRGGGCRQLPGRLSRNEIRAAGAQVIVVSDCGEGASWQSVAHAWDNRLEERPRNYTDFPKCGGTFSRATYNRRLIRYYEDSTQLTAQTGDPDDGISSQTAARMARCGVDLIGFDQLAFNEPRLAGLVWSWAPRQPQRGACAVQRVDRRRQFGRWYSRGCRLERRPACRRRANGAWVIPSAPVPQRAAARSCRAAHAVHAVPRTGYEAQLLRRAMKRAGAREVWLGYRVVRGRWAGLDRRS